ncbi:MAG: hypothetical protein E4H37_04515 [Gemmatimonadales bacterium]|nr:MAG: hypothetical protein E4H37_04515 [Gemmatimonadales bacterium]
MNRLQVLLGVVGLVVMPTVVSGQVVIEEYEPTSGLLRIGPESDRAIELTDKGYTLILPAEGTTAGLAVFFDGWRVAVSEGMPPAGTFDHEALSRGVGILRLTTGNPLDFYFDDATLRSVADRIQRVLTSHQLDRMPLYFAGLSLGGTRALKLTVFLKQHPGEFWIAPAAVAVVDAPLDMARLWRAEQRAIQRAFNPTAADEGRWVSYLLETNLGGTPDQQLDRYVQYSPFTYSAPGGRGGNAVFLRDVSIRAYHEPDVDWWIEQRRKDFYGMNSIDLAALINELKLQGNGRAELITTYRARDGVGEGSSPHTWSFVDNADLVEWFLAQPVATGDADTRPVTAEVKAACAAIDSIVRGVTGWAVDRFDGKVFDDPTRSWRRGCRVVTSGPTAALDEANDPAERLRTRLAALGWTEVLDYSADGPGTTAYAFRTGQVLCVASAGAPSYLADDGEIVVAERYEVDAGCFLDPTP